MTGFDFKKYFIRVVKYMIYFAIIFTLIIAIFSISQGQGFNYSSLFRQGTENQLIIFFVVISFVYPLIGFAKKPVYLNKSFEEEKEVIKGIFENARYTVAEQTSTTITFRHTSPFIRMMRMYEDAIVIDFSDNPVIMTGLRKDLQRMARAIEYATRKNEEEQQ